MEQLVSALRADFPQFSFAVGEIHCWSPAEGQISYQTDESPLHMAGLLHEVAHAILGHRSYQSDLDLLQKEVAAWDKAAQLADTYHTAFDGNHAQNCLDTYREWVYKRSTCPSCSAHGVQQTTTSYHCLNCGGVWQVTAHRFRRPYRRSDAHKNRVVA
ncbi:MAG TPA: hypothetical protein VLH84_01575 [Patescibacteria group bacterium]|nr:hypothetical protein [Patescibacteria group bacterium]